MDMLKRKFDPGGNHVLSMGELNPAIPKNKLRQYVNSLSTCSALWDNYAYFLSNFKVSGHTSKPFKCKSTDTYIIPGENRTISSSFRATTGQWVGLILSSSFLTRVLACLLI